MFTFTRTIVSAMVVVLVLATAASFGADPGVTATEIKIGHITAYSGPASAYGTIGKAMGGYFKKINDEGGINGRKITFVSVDDAFSPPKTVEMTRKLVEQEKILFLINVLGTAPNSAIHKYMNQQKVPHLFLATGATKWGDPKNFPWTMGFAPSYQAEARIYAQYIMKNVPDAKVSILYQNDDFGKDHLKNLTEAFGDNAKKLIVAQQSYELTDPLVDSQIVNLKNSGANVFVNITTAKAATQSIKKAHDIGWKPLHVLNVGAISVNSVLKPAGLEASKGLITATYSKDPTDPQWKNDPGYKEYVAFMQKYYPDGTIDDVFNAYALLVAQTTVQVLKQCGTDVSRASVMKQAASLKDLSLGMLLPGIKLNTGPDDYFPVEQMQLARFDGERWVLFGEVLDASKK
jgi:branched-chain amino acid transport system substrate-binding protein